MALGGLFDDTISCLNLYRGAEVLRHLLTGHTDEICGEIEAQIRFECYVDLLF